MQDNVYQKLAVHLDTLPGGFISSDPAADLRVLQRLFCPEEAALAVHLTLERESAQTIAERAGKPLEETRQRLDRMSSSGLIYSTQPDDSPALYQAVPFVIGIFEFQINRLDKHMIRDLAYYWRARDGMLHSGDSIPQIRTIPIGESIDPHLEVYSYEQVNELVEANDRFAVAPCICRRTAHMLGGGCDAPEESCLVFGEWADYYVRDGRGRRIERSDVYDILAKADEANLVLQPSNSKDACFICCCCGCCCGILGQLKKHPNPSQAVASAFIAELDADQCIGCWVCMERCQMDAFSEDIDHVTFNPKRCIGCGLCVSTCPSGALTLKRKPQSVDMPLPDTMDGTWRAISQS